MADSWKKLLVISLACHAAAFGLLLLVSVFSFTTRTVLAEFQWAWIISRTWAEYFRLAPVFQGWAVLIVFAWIEPMTSGPRGASSFDRFGHTVVLLLIAALVFTVGFLTGYPHAASREDSLELTTTLARRLRESADAARRERDYDRAVSDLSRYLALVGPSEDAETQLTQLRQQVRLERPSVATDAPPVRTGIPSRATAAGLVDRAEAAMAEADYSTAHFMAIMARSIDSRNHAAALLAAKSLERLGSFAPDNSESEAADLFRRKQTAKGALTRQELIDAYYLFAAIAEEYPRDEDARRYLRLAEDQVVSLAVFRDEMEEALRAPGAPGVVFVNRSDDTGTELVAVGKLVATPHGLYAQQIESIRTDRHGQVVKHVSGDYGKLVDGHFVLNVIGRGALGSQLRPTVHAGEDEGVSGGLLAVDPSAYELRLLAEVSRNPAAASIVALTRTITALDSYGLIAEPVQLEFLMRVVGSFAFLIFPLVLLGFGRRYRSRYLHLPPVPTLILIPLLPFVLLPIYQGYLYAQRIALSASLLTIGLAGSLVLAVVFQAILLFLALIYLAVGSRE